MSRNSEDYDHKDYDFKGYQTSPSQVKMKYLTDKISYFQNGLEAESQVRSDTFLSRIRSIEDKVSKMQISEESKLNVIQN